MTALDKPETKTALRTIDSSSRLRAAIIAVFSGLALALAFPRVGLAWLAPVGAGALFWAWQNASLKRAALLGWLSGLVFFTISFWWWSTTIAGTVGILAYAAVIFSAGLEAIAIAAAGVLTVLALRRAPVIAPIASAAAFALTEWVRSIGVIGVPFAQLGVTQVETPLRALGAYIGTPGLTFVTFALGAYGAYAVARRHIRAAAVFAAAVIMATIAAWAAWPARYAPPPGVPVAAVQGDIAQSLKWQPGALMKAVTTYTALTRGAIPQGPRLIVWPETVIALNGSGLDQNPALAMQFTQLAQQAKATIVAGSIDVHAGSYYNALYLFGPLGISGVYDKRQLVPFAEHFPGQRYLGWLPYIGSLNGNFAEGDGTGVLPTMAGLRIGMLICWESAFGDLAYDEVQNGAQVLVVATDDAWFGTSSGPYQHAQIAQMRAIESGEYVVRAAATDISGIINPDGSWQSRMGLEQLGVSYGRVGPPAPTVYARIGPARMWFALLAVYVVSLIRMKRREEA